MKKEYIAIYICFGLCFITFTLVIGLGALGFETQSLIAAGVALMVFGLSIMIGVYSNIKNYGYFYSGNKRTYKGTTGYSLMTGILRILAVALFGAGILIAVHNYKKLNKSEVVIPRELSG